MGFSIKDQETKTELLLSITLTMSHSATRLSLRAMAFCARLSMGLALSEIGNDFVRLPSGRSLREAKVRHFETGPVHNNLEKRCK